MAILATTNRTELREAWAAYTAGDTITLSANEFSAENANTYIVSDVRTSGAIRVKPVTITAADPLNPPLVLDLFLETRRYGGVKVSRINMRGTTSVSGWVDAKNRPVPAAQGAISFREYQDMTVEDCWFDFYRKAMDWTKPGDGIASSNGLLQYCDFTRLSMDSFIVRTVTNGFTCRGIYIGDEAIPPAHYKEKGWHPDFGGQWGRDNPATGSHANHLIEDMLVEAILGKGPFIADNDFPKSAGAIMDGLQLRNLQITSGRLIGIGLHGCKNVSVDRVLLRDAEQSDGTKLEIGRYAENIALTNSVLPRPVRFDTDTGQTGPGTVEGYYLGTGSVDGVPRVTTFPATAVPAGHVPLVRGVNVGVRPASGAPIPPRMVNETTDGRIAAATWPEVAAGRFTRVARLPVGSAALAAVNHNPENIQWCWPAGGVPTTNPQPFVVAVPASSGGADRFRMDSLSGDVAWTVGYAEQMAGVLLRYRADTGGPWSEWSAYGSNADLSPAAPPVGTLDPLDASRWGEDGLAEVVDGYFAPRIWTNPAVGQPSAVEWIKPGVALAMPCIEVGVDGSGRTLWLFRPTTFSGQEHVVGYGKIMTGVRVRYWYGESVSDWSVPSDGKSISGPTAPTPVLAPGLAILGDGDAPYAVAGIALVTAHPDRPQMPVRGDYTISPGPGEDEFTVNAPFDPPYGAIRVCVSYAGRTHRIQGTALTLPVVSGRSTAFVRAIASDGTPSLGLPLRVAGA